LPSLRAHHARVAETTAVQALPAILTIDNVGPSGVSRVLVRAHRAIVAPGTARSRASLRQHFLKRDAVFFDVLVYSE
jgi:hypothetical protein